LRTSRTGRVRKPSLEDDTSECTSSISWVELTIRTQFNLLRSLPKAQPQLIASIVSCQLPPSKVAVLTSADLASAERQAELQEARKSALAQTVRQREDALEVRLGRDGFEKVEDVREREMKQLAHQEDVARKEADRRESMTLHELHSDQDTPVSLPLPSPTSAFMPSGTMKPPTLERTKTQRSESIDVDSPRVKQAPRVSFDLTSAWGGASFGDDGTGQEIIIEDQSALDLSDLVHIDDDEPILIDRPEEVVSTKLPEPAVKPVAWRGTVSTTSSSNTEGVANDRSRTLLMARNRQELNYD
jgi:hypothetical protein